MAGRHPAADTSGIGTLTGFTKYVNNVVSHNGDGYDQLLVASGIMYRLLRQAAVRKANVDTLMVARAVRKDIRAASGFLLDANEALRHGQGLIVAKFGVITSGNAANPSYFDSSK